MSVDLATDIDPDIPAHSGPTRWDFLKKFGPGTISVVYLYVIAFVIFSLWIPDLWLSGVTQKSVLNISMAVPGMLAIAVMIPLAAGAFDLSVAGIMTLSAFTSAWLMTEVSLGVGWSIVLGVLVGLLAGTINAVLVVVVKIRSLIATLGMGAVFAAAASWLSGGTMISGLSKEFVQFSAKRVLGGAAMSVVYLLIIAVVVWYVFEHTPIGRYLQATGENSEASLLAGVRTNRYVFGSLVAAGGIAGFAGIVQASTVAAAGQNLGDAFLLPAFAAVFLGATQFKHRFNVWGTLIAIWVLASGVQGVTLALGSFTWLNNLFFGIALVAAVGSSITLDRIEAYRAARARSVAATKSRSDILNLDETVVAEPS